MAFEMSDLSMWGRVALVGFRWKFCLSECCALRDLSPNGLVSGAHCLLSWSVITLYIEGECLLVCQQQSSPQCQATSVNPSIWAYVLWGLRLSIVLHSKGESRSWEQLGDGASWLLSLGITIVVTGPLKANVLKGLVLEQCSERFLWSD